MTRRLMLGAAASLIVCGVFLLSVPVGLIVAGLLLGLFVEVE